MRLPKRLARATTLPAAALLAVSSVAIVVASRAGNPASSGKQVRLLAAIIIQQSANILNGYHKMEMDGDSYQQSTFDTRADGGLCNPAAGGALQQYAPVAALMPGDQNCNWTNGATVQVNGAAADASENMFFLQYVTDSVCSAINQLLLNDPAVPVIAHNDVAVAADTNQHGDWRGTAPPAGITEMCAQSGGDDIRMLYAVVDAMRKACQAPVNFQEDKRLK